MTGLAGGGDVDREGGFELEESAAFDDDGLSSLVSGRGLLFGTGSRRCIRFVKNPDRRLAERGWG